MTKFTTLISISFVLLLVSFASSSAANSFKGQYSFIIESITELPPQTPFFRYDASNDEVRLDRRKPKAILDELEIFIDPQQTHGSRYNIQLWGGHGFLEIGGTEVVLCNINGYVIQSCVYGLAGFKTIIGCVESYWHTRNKESFPILRCTRSVSGGTGTYFSDFHFFINKNVLQYIGSIPKHSIESLGGGVLQAEVEVSKPGFDSEGIVSACPTLSFQKNWREKFSRTKVACSAYEFDVGGKTLAHVAGPDIRRRSFIEIFQNEFRKLGFEQ